MWGWFILGYVVLAGAGVTLLCVFLFRSSHDYHRFRCVVHWPEGGHVPRPVECSACGGSGMKDKNKNPYKIPTDPSEKGQLWQRLCYAWGTSRTCGECQGRGFRSSELPQPRRRIR